MEFFGNCHFSQKYSVVTYFFDCSVNSVQIVMQLARIIVYMPTKLLSDQNFEFLFFRVIMGYCVSDFGRYNLTGIQLVITFFLIQISKI